MALEVTLFFIAIYAVITLIALPFQYKYVKVLKEMEVERQQKGLNQEDMYDSMNFETQQLHFNAQGNPLLIPANLLATGIYHLRHKRV